ncbi:DUF429 domain-containing protein [Roseomonas sp. CCTCC AB2023176]|uniref:DUF429 domain-containing protein n=1 Tax=Roseomonas sp. CCTCC AB2023176 TaxID=3342640 RepID=UPI0035DAEC70
MTAAARILGVDAAKRGWAVAEIVSSAVKLSVDTFLDEMVAEASPGLIAIDAPIGLPTRYERGGRACELQARKLIGPRRSSVFATPPRDIVGMSGRRYDEVAAAMRERRGVGLSQQSFAIHPRIREVDALVRRLGQSRVVEVRPEFCFFVRNGRSPLFHSKKVPEGLEQRRRLLESAFGPLRFEQPQGAQMDDCLDAIAALWTARRVANGQPARLPTEGSPVDGCGLRMEMWA